MYYLVEAFGKTGMLAGQRTCIGLEAATLLYTMLKQDPNLGEVNIYSTEVTGGLIDKGERIYV